MEEKNQLTASAAWQLEPFTADQKTAFAILFSEGKSINECIDLTQINRATYEYHRRQDKWFRAMLATSRDVHCDDLEAAMLARGKAPEGTTDRVKYLEAYRSDIHGKRQNNAPVEININIDPDRLRAVDAHQESIDIELSREYNQAQIGNAT